MASGITPQERERMEEFIRKHPVDHRYDKQCEFFDGDVPEEQLLARDFKRILDENPE